MLLITPQDRVIGPREILPKIPAAAVGSRIGIRLSLSPSPAGVLPFTDRASLLFSWAVVILVIGQGVVAALLELRRLVLG
jgi:hypothetical protein